MKNDYSAVFNGLSGKGRVTLKTAATFDAITDFIREDTKRHPWRFPFYALYMSMLVIPVPLFGVPAAIAGAAVLCARYEVGGVGKRLNTHLKQAFQEAVLAERYQEHIQPDTSGSGRYAVRPWGLAWHSAKYGFKNARIAASEAYEAAKDYILK